MSVSSPARFTIEQIEELRRLQDSRLLLRSPRLRELLIYLVDCMVNGRLEEIKEPAIGQHVFGRPEGYNHTEDNIVRVSVRNLRQKLEEHYATEGSDSQWLLEIPRGGYVPILRLRHPEPEKTEPPVALVHAAMASREAKVSRRELAAWSLAALGLGATGWQLLQPAKRPVDSVIEGIFPPSGKRVNFVVLDSGLGAYRRTTWKTVPLSEYQQGRWLQTDATMPALLQNLLQYNRRARDTGISSLQMLQQVLEVLPSSQVRLRHPAEFSERDLQDDHAILHGGPWINPWSQLFEDRLNFRMELVTPVNSRIRNVTPRAEEPEYFQTHAEGANRRGYVRLAVLPNFSGSGRILLVGATTHAGIEASGHFLCSPGGLPNVLKQLGVADLKQVKGIELVMEVLSASNTPVNFRIVASRVIR
jgi:hypothetical protein